MRRDREHEARFLAHAEQAAAWAPEHGKQPGDWARHVIDRLDARGHSITPRPLPELLHELGEEAADLGGWAAIAVGLHRGDTRLHDTLIEIAALGCAAHRLLAREARR